MRRLALALLVALAMAVGSSSAAAPESATAPAVKKPCKLVSKVVRGKRVKVRVCPKARTKCKFVTKRIKGKKKRVRVCTKTKRKPTPPRQDVVARTVAERLAGATTVREREQALLEAARALHLGVYRADGTPVLTGAERSDHDFFLYDFEVTILAQALSRGESLDLGGLAVMLSNVGVRSGANPLPPEQLAGILVSGTQAALRSPTNPRAIVPLLVRELGLRASPAYDLAREAPAGIRLDALQRFLLAADAASSLRASRFPAVASSPRSHIPSPGCGRFSGNPNLDMWFGGYRWTSQDSEYSAVQNHVMLLSEALELRDLTPGAQETHYGHEEPGRSIQFRASLVMTVDVPKAIRCGPLAGRRVPEKGEVTDPKAITWTSEVATSSGSKHSLAPRHGETVERVIIGGASHGSHTYTYSPRNERFPGFGTERVASGEVRATVKIAESVGEEGLALQKSIAWPVKVRYHKPRGFRFSGVKISFQTTEQCAPDGGPCILETAASGRVCGDDPYAKPWDIHQSFISNFGHAPSADYPLSLDQPFSIPETGFRQALEWLGATGQPDYKVKFTYEVATGWPPTSPSSVTVPLAEDTICPEND